MKAIRQVDQFERRVAVQHVIDRLIEFGQEYLESLALHNSQFEVKNHKIYNKNAEDTRNNRFDGKSELAG